MSLTVSMSVGRIAILHDVRKEISANVDTNLSYRNVIFIDKLADYNYSLEAYTNARFQPYIDEYNIGKKNCRQIHETYVEHIQKENEKLLQKAAENKSKGINTSVRKPTKLAHEYVIQVGNRDTNPVADYDYANEEYCEEVLKAIQEKYPHANILLATYHADEPNGTPHMHILVQFEGEGYQKGLSHQISISKALELDGFERSANRGDYAINRWTKDIQDTIMTEKLQEIMFSDREVLGEHRKHEDLPFFREKAKREAAALEEKKEELIQTHKNLDSKIQSQTAEVNTLMSIHKAFLDDSRKEPIEIPTTKGKREYTPLPELQRQSDERKKDLTEATRELFEVKKEVGANNAHLSTVKADISLLEAQKNTLTTSVGDLKAEINELTVKRDKISAQAKDGSSQVYSEVTEYRLGNPPDIDRHVVRDERDELVLSRDYEPQFKPISYETAKGSVELTVNDYPIQERANLFQRLAHELQQVFQRLARDFKEKFSKAQQQLLQAQSKIQDAELEAQVIVHEAEVEVNELLENAKTHPQKVIEANLEAKEQKLHKMLGLVDEQAKLDALDKAIECYNSDPYYQEIGIQITPDISDEYFERCHAKHMGEFVRYYKDIGWDDFGAKQQYDKKYPGHHDKITTLQIKSEEYFKIKDKPTTLDDIEVKIAEKSQKLHKHKGISLS